MKLKFFPAFTCLSVCLLLAAPPLLRAQEEGKDDDANEPAEEETQEQLTPEQLKERIKKENEAEKAEVDRMMKVFSSLEGAWTGRESLRYEEDRLPAQTWKDEWEGKFTFGGRYFEMNGQTEGGEENIAYKWVCTYDHAEKRYRAWYFGDNGQNEYSGKLSQDGKYVIWTTKNQATGFESRFTMKPEGNRVKCHGTETDGNGNLFATQSSEYTRKRVEL